MKQLSALAVLATAALAVAALAAGACGGRNGGTQRDPAAPSGGGQGADPSAAGGAADASARSPGAPGVEGLDALIPGVTEYLEGRAAHWGFAVLLPDRGEAYQTNGLQPFPLASLAKIVIMLAFLWQHYEAGTAPSTDDEELLERMIGDSDNNATWALWERIGEGEGFDRFLAAQGIEGVAAAPPGYSWGDAAGSALGVARVLALLYEPDFLDAGLRESAAGHLARVVEEQRWGASEVFPPEIAADGYGIKNGWYPGQTGWRVNSAAIALGAGLEPMVFAGLTRTQHSFEYALATIERVARQAGNVLYGTPAAPLPARPGAPPPTDLRLFQPDSAGVIRRPGECPWASAAVAREGAVACIVEAQVHDPCFLDADGRIAICGAVPGDVSAAFGVAAGPPAGAPTAPSGAGQPWYIELEDGASCRGVEPVPFNDDADPITFACEDGRAVIGPLQEARTWWAYVEGAGGSALVRVAVAWF